jgi:threonyl-tRNA synthetase
MITITLPDGSQRPFETPLTAQALASSIAPSLEKAAIAAKVNGQIVDLSYLIEADSEVAILTEKNPEALDVIRHSTAHLLGQAVKQLFPKAQVTIGPVIEDGFFYDFAYPAGFTPEDLLAIEKRMRELAAQNLPVTRSVLSRDEAIEFFKKQGEIYKAEIIEGIPSTESLSLYTQGDFTDLCRGPHVPSTGKLKAFKLMKLAGAYWRGDAKNEMLQRIYGTAWLTQKDLEDHLFRLEEAEKRDHRKLAKKLDLFHLQEEAPGMVFWHPNGWRIYQTIKTYLQKVLHQNGYQEVNTPLMADYSLWEKSGHADKFAENMFGTESENRRYAIKPMNCPCHVQIFNQGLKSYRDLPIRFSEFGCCHRNEPSGSLHGIMRVRGFTQDDAHIFCTEEQAPEEAAAFIKLLYQVYEHFGFKEVIVKLSTRPEKRFGDDALWDMTEGALARALDKSGVTWSLNPGEGAFYGPKIEFALKDCLNRVWQCGTLQLDAVLPQRLGAEYVSETSERKTPLMLHRAIFGSLERFIGILLEHYAEGLPFWLSPIQIVVINVSEKQAEYTKLVSNTLIEQGFMVESDLSNEKIGFKIRTHAMKLVPYIVVIGDREVETSEITVRNRKGEDLGSMSMERFIKLMSGGDY